jgi:hypothetical protein
LARTRASNGAGGGSEMVVTFSSHSRATAALLAFVAFSHPAVAAESALPATERRAMEQVSFAYFQEQLAPFGQWLRHPVWGDVWQPDAGRNFRPYFYGDWQYTSDYGWLWVSNEAYGDIVYHYGRWGYDPNFGWLWVPGYIWGPSWVAWRETDGYVGWLPMPPGYQDFSYTTATPSYAPNNWYGYQHFYGDHFARDAFLGLWLFAPNQDFGRRDRRPYVTDKDRLRELYRDSRDRTHYVLDRDHDRIVDRSIDKDALEQSTRRSFGAQEGASFLHGHTPVISVTEGQELARHYRRGPAVSAPGIQGGAGSGPLESRGFAGRLPRAQDAKLPPGAQNAADAGGRQVPDNRRAQFRAAPRRDPSALGGIGMPRSAIAPLTDGLRGAQSSGLPAAIPQAGLLPNARPSALAPESVLGRMRLRGLGGPAAVPSPSIANAAAPAMSQQTSGLQQSPALQRPAMGAPAVTVPSAPPLVVPAPRSVDPRLGYRRPLGQLP